MNFKTASLPTFLLIGASKTGTTTIHYYLRQHPQVFVPSLKEPGFFAFEGQSSVNRGRRGPAFVTDLEDYKNLFRQAAGKTAIGDCSPQYFDNATAAVIERIKRYVPDVQIVLLLRNPLTWALSAYWMRVRDGLEPALSFREAIERERYEAASGQKTQPRYLFKEPTDSERLSLYLEAFDSKQMRIYLYDDFVADQEKFMAEFFSFINVDRMFKPDFSGRKNVSGLPLNPLVAYLFNHRNPVRALSRLLLPKAVRENVREFFITPIPSDEKRAAEAFLLELREDMRDEVLRLQRMIGRDLSHWLD